MFRSHVIYARRWTRSCPHMQLTPLTVVSPTMPPNMRMRSNTAEAPPSTPRTAPSMLFSPGLSIPPLPVLLFATSLLPGVLTVVAPSFAPAFFFAAAPVAVVPFSEPADRALTSTVLPPIPPGPTGFHSFTSDPLAATAVVFSLCVSGDPASLDAAASTEDGDVAGPPCCSWVSPPSSTSSPVTEIAVCKHRCPENSIPPLVSNEDQFKPTVSSKKITDDPQFFPPPTKTTVFPSQTGVAVW